MNDVNDGGTRWVRYGWYIGYYSVVSGSQEKVEKF